MDVAISTIDQVTVAKLTGEIDATTASTAQQQVLAVVTPGARIILDMSDVPYMSSAGLRMLLSLFRNVSANSGRIALVGVTEDIQDTMSVTGFLKFFTLYDTVADAVGPLTQ
jgi:anti-sigma B factor antagonist